MLSVVMRDSRSGGPYRVHIRVSADDPGIADTSDPITTIPPAGLSAQYNSDLCILDKVGWKETGIGTSHL